MGNASVTFSKQKHLKKDKTENNAKVKTSAERAFPKSKLRFRKAAAETMHTSSGKYGVLKIKVKILERYYDEAPIQ